LQVLSKPLAKELERATRDDRLSSAMGPSSFQDRCVEVVTEYPCIGWNDLVIEAESRFLRVWGWPRSELSNNS